MRRKICLLLTVLLLPLLMLGCGDLSRGKAAELLNAEKKNNFLSLDVTLRKHVTRRQGVTRRQDVYSMFWYYLDGQTKTDQPARNLLPVLAKAGYIIIDSNNNDNFVCTKEHATFCNGGDAGKYAKFKKVIVTGISQKDGFAEAKFHLVYSSIGELGRIVAKNSSELVNENGTRRFRKYDDGWRLVR